MKSEKKDKKVLLQPNYKRIYSDIINMKYPDKADDCKNILNKEKLSCIDIRSINKLIFGDNIRSRKSGKHHSYKRDDILLMLDYQKKHGLNNTQLANHFKLSRNSVGKWKKMFAI